MTTGKYKRKHYKCLKCNIIISQRESHLEKYHEDEIFYLNLKSIENGEELEKIFSQWFIESIEELTTLTENYSQFRKRIGT